MGPESGSPPVDMGLDALAAWLVANGGKISGVETRTLAAGGRGIFATRDLENGECIVHLPQKLLLTGDVARAVPHVAAVLADAEEAGVTEMMPEYAASDDETIAIVLFLLSAQSRRGSVEGQDWVDCEVQGVDWAPWLDKLPKCFETPTTVSEKRLTNCLEGSPLHSIAMLLRQELRVLFDEFVLPYAVEKYPEAYPPGKATYEAFLWAFSVTASRTFGSREGACLNDRADDSTLARDEPIKDGSESSVCEQERSILTPFCDMMNHACEQESVSVFVKLCYSKNDCRAGEVDGFQMIVRSSNVRSGQELFISYGGLENAPLLLHYGFAFSPNPHNRIPLTLDEPDSSEPQLYAKKLILLGMACPGRLAMEFDLTAANPLPEGIFATLRLLLMSPQDAQSVSRHTDFFHMLNPLNEAAVLDYIDGVVSQLLIPKRQCGIDVAQGSFEQFCDVYMQGFANIAKLALDIVQVKRSKLSASLSGL